jgi:hypothetical protein
VVHLAVVELHGDRLSPGVVLVDTHHPPGTPRRMLHPAAFRYSTYTIVPFSLDWVG